MNGDKKFKEIYNKFFASYGELIEEHTKKRNGVEQYVSYLINKQAGNECNKIS